MKLLAILALSACSDPTAKPDAAIDAPKVIDAKAADAGMCGSDTLFTGEHLDWDSTDATFCGVFNAVWKVRGSTDPKQTHTTPPNGRLVMCVPSVPSTAIDVTVPAGNSPCLGMTSGYTINGIAHVEPAVLATLPATEVFRARSFTTARQATFYSLIGATYDPAKGGLLVHVAGTPKATSIDVAHATTMAYDGTTWAVGATGADVYFPNVAIGTAVITVVGVTGVQMVPIAANTITYATFYSP